MVMVLSTLLDPSLLIADEITSALDVSTQKAVAGILVEFREHGFVKSMIVITHDISILYQVADTILVMYAGQLAEKAPAGVIIDAPRHPYTKLLISSLQRWESVRGQAARRDPRRATDAARSADGLPIPRPLSARDRAVQGTAALRPSPRSLRRRAGGLRHEPTHPRRGCSKIYKVGAFGGNRLTAVRDVDFDVQAARSSR